MKKIYLYIFCLIGCSGEIPSNLKIINQSRFPRLSSNANGEIFMSWFEQVDSINWSIRSSIYSGAKWSEPTVVSNSSSYFINWADFPSLNYINKDTLVSHWLEKSGSGTYDYDVHLSFSFDKGKSWKSSQIPHSTKIKGEHGFSSFGLGRNIHDLLWLDGRQMIMDHNKGSYGQMNLYHTTFSSDGVIGKEYLIDEKVCECCPTSAVRYKDTLVVAYRNRDDNEIRDIFIARKVKDEWEEPYSVHKDNWQIAGCPVNGPMLAINKSNVVIAWYTAANESAQIKVAFSRDVGETFSNPIMVDNTMPIGRVDIDWIDNENIIVSWIRASEKTSDIIVKVINIINGEGKEFFVESIPQGRISGYPQMEVVDNKALFAWTEINEKTSVTTKWISLNQLQ